MYVYSNHLDTVQWLTYDPELFDIYFLYSYSWNKGGDSLIPAVSASMNHSSNKRSVQRSHKNLVNISFDPNLNIINNNEEEH